MRLTERCLELLKLLQTARWLTTGQVHRRFFRNATISAARRRLRRLGRAGYVRKHQENRMREALFTLGSAGKRLLECNGAKGIGLERQPPRQLAHAVGINDIRVAAELCEELEYFFAAWELPGIGWHYPVMPDAVFRLGGRTFAVEYDRGLEGLRYFVGSKIARYRSGFAGFPLAAVLVVADSETRREALARGIADDRGRFLFTTIGAIRHEGIPKSIRSQGPFRHAGPPAATCSLELSTRENRVFPPSDSEPMT